MKNIKKKINIQFDITGATDTHCENCPQLSFENTPRYGYYPRCLVFNCILKEDKIKHNGVYKPLREKQCIKCEEK